MLVEIWVTTNGQYNFYYHDFRGGYFVLKNGEYDGAYDTLEECKEYTVDYDKLWGDDTFLYPKQD